MKMLFLLNSTNFRKALPIASKTNITIMAIFIRKFPSKICHVCQYWYLISVMKDFVIWFISHIIIIDNFPKTQVVPACPFFICYKKRFDISKENIFRNSLESISRKLSVTLPIYIEASSRQPHNINIYMITKNAKICKSQYF